ncbi:MAG: hypothetical protein AAFN77_08320 [Planctomycetota bacterium]
MLFDSQISAQENNIGGKARLKSWEQHQAMAAASPFKDLKWQVIGPKFAGGRIESIASPVGDRKTIYAGVGSGGVWKSINAGLTWQAIFADQSTYAIGDIAVAPSDPTILWVGTGECHTSRSSYAGNGVYKSTDAGATWKNMGLHESGHIGSVVIDPKNPDHVFVASLGKTFKGGERGIFRTTDGGTEFENVLDLGKSVSFVDLIIDPFNRKRLFASAWDRRGNQSGVYRSDDAGDNWIRLTEGLPTENIDRVAIDMSQSKEGVIYALMADRSNPNLAKRRNAAMLYRSDDGGDHWRVTHQGNVPTYVGWDFCDVRVATDDVEQVFIGGVRMIRSNDGGKTFLGEGGFKFNTRVDEVFRLHPHRGLGVHLDVHDIWINPEDGDHMMLGNDGGLFVSQDRGNTWLHLNSLPIAEFYRVHLDQEEPFRIWGGTQDNASFVGPSTDRFRGGVDGEWQQVFLDPWSGGDGFATFPDPVDPSITFYTQQNGDLKRSKLGRLRPERGIRPKSKSGNTPLRFDWDTPFFASVHSDRTVLYCAAQRVLKSTDRGDSWDPISEDLSRQGLLALAESPLKANRLAAGNREQRIHVTKDGAAWSATEKLNVGKAVLRDLEWSHHQPDRLFVVYSGKTADDCGTYVFVSDDAGQRWRSIAGNLPAESANAIVEDPDDPHRLYLATDLGVYLTEDGGKEWSSLCATLPTAPVVDLALHSRDHQLVAATHGLSLFLLDVKSIRK